MAVSAMKTGKYAGVEVPCAITLQECWDLVKTHEATGVPCMMLENWSFRRDNLAVLNMIRKGLFGEIVHCHCAHSHNCMDWYFDAQGKPRWSGNHLLKRNADQYPTHSLGPVLSWMDINCGDRFDYAGVDGIAIAWASRTNSNASSAKTIPPAKLPYLQGDIVTTMVKTVKGNTIVIAMDMQLPRPYDNRWQIQGTRGLYNEQRNAVYIEGRKPQVGPQAVGALPALPGEVRTLVVEERRELPTGTAAPTESSCGSSSAQSARRRKRRSTCTIRW